MQVDTNTFQVALIYNTETSFVFFFYDEINVASNPVNVGFSPSSFRRGSRESFMLQGVLNGSSVFGGSNVGIPGTYAYRVDFGSFIVEPQGSQLECNAQLNIIQ